MPDEAGPGLLDAVGKLAPLLREHAAGAERARRLADPVVDALIATGAHRMLVPARYGGGEVDPLTLMRVVETVSEADGAAGWVLNIWATSASSAWFVHENVGHEVFGDPAVAHAGAFAPTARATAVEGGWSVTGRWMWGSGTTHAGWISGGAMCEDGMRLMFFPAGDVTIHDTWFASGLRATGSNDFEVREAFVPAGREVAVGKIGPQTEGALGAFPNFCLLAAGVAACCLGIARRAIEEVVLLAREKKPAMSGRTLAEHVPAQLSIGQAEAALGAGRAFLFEEVTAAWDATRRGGRVSTEQRARIRLAAAHAAHEAARATDLAYHTGGGSSVFESSVLQRCFRDIHTALAHQMLGEQFILAQSRLRLGLEPGTPFL